MGEKPTQPIKFVDANRPKLIGSVKDATGEEKAIWIDGRDAGTFRRLQRQIIDLGRELKSKKTLLKETLKIRAEETDSPAASETLKNAANVLISADVERGIEKINKLKLSRKKLRNHYKGRVISMLMLQN